MSPISGVVIKKDVLRGTHVKPGQEIFRVANLGILWIYIHVFEKDLPFIRKGQSVSVESVSFPGEKFSGRIDLVYPFLDMETRDVKVRIIVPNTKGRLKPGMYVRVNIEALIARDIVTIPAKSVIYSGEKNYVFVSLGRGEFEVRPVTVLSQDDARAAVSEGLKENEQVVANGQFLMMHGLGVAANIMSMGGIAIAIGVMVDASVVMVENTHKHLEKLAGGSGKLAGDLYWKAAKDATLEVAPGLFWSMIIIIVSFLPVFALPEQSGRLFIPLALTKTLAMTASAFFAVVLLPILVGYFVRGRIPSEEKHPVSRFLHRVYTPSLTWSLDHKKAIVIGALIAIALSLVPVIGLPVPFTDKHILKPIGSEFMPPLNEVDLLYMPTTVPGISIAKAREILIETDRLIMKVPEVETVFGKVGRADTATDPAPLSMIETTILLKDRSQWRDGMTIDKIVEELDKTVKLPGLVNAWTMPIKTRIDMLSTGIKTPLGIKIMGDDLETLQRITQTMEGRISTVPGVTSVFGERVEGANYVVYDIDRDKAGLYGLYVKDIEMILSSALGGRTVTEIISGPYRWSANIRYLRSYRESIESLKNILIPLPNGGQIPVSAVADIRFEKGPGAIKTENARLTSWLYVDTRSSDIGGLADRLKTALDGLISEKDFSWPAGYSYAISGQYEQMKLAADRMQILIPLVIVIVFIILFIHFRNASHPIWVMGTAIFFAPLGGIWFMYLSGYNRSVASDVGFIALIGLAAETGVIMLVYLDEAMKDLKKGEFGSLREAVIHGAVMRVRPKMMTVLTTMLGLSPLFWGSEPGNSAMRRIASPMVGGLVTSKVVTLILHPVIYEWWYESDKKDLWNKINNRVSKLFTITIFRR